MKGRPCKLDEARATLIVRAIRRGASREAAAAVAGVSKGALMKWLKKGREGEDPTDLYGDLFHRVKKAESSFERRLVKRIELASLDPKNWTAAAWLLERRFGTRWARKDTTKVKMPALPDPKTMTPAQVDQALVAALEARRKLAGVN